MITQFLSAAAAISLLGAGIVSSAETRSFQAMTPLAGAAGTSQANAANMCRVEVVRTGTPGAVEITRRALSDGSCVCVATTGSAESNGTSEDVVTNLLRERKCDDAIAPNAKAAQAGGGAGIFGLFAVLGAGTGAAAGSDSAS